MSNKNSLNNLVNLTMKELTKIMEDVKNGKNVEMPASLKKLSSELETANQNHKSMTNEEIDRWAEKIVNEISKLKD